MLYDGELGPLYTMDNLYDHWRQGKDTKTIDAGS